MRRPNLAVVVAAAVVSSVAAVLLLSLGVRLLDLRPEGPTALALLVGTVLLASLVTGLLVVASGDTHDRQ